MTTERVDDLAVPPLRVGLGDGSWVHWFDKVTQSWQSLIQLLGINSATATLDFPSISAGADAELTISVARAEVNDPVVVGPPGGLEANLSVTGFVSAAGVVTVRLVNPTGAPINPVSATYRVSVLRY